MTRIAATPSRNIRRWDARFNLHQPRGWRSQSLRKFAELSSRRIEPVPKDDESFVARGSIHFDGTISIRDTRSGKGRVFYAYPGDLVFSKIDARNGAFGVLSPDGRKLAFSSEFPIYELEARQFLRPQFMQILCRTKGFQERINSLVVGHSGRRRLSPEMFEDLEIPAPTLSDQEEIVSKYANAIAKADEVEQRASDLIVEASQQLLDELGIRYSPPESAQRYFSAHFHQLSSWAVKKVRHVCAGSESIEGHYPMVSLGEPNVGEIVYGLAKSPQNRPGDHARPYLRVANVQAGSFDLSEIKKINVPDDLMDRYAVRSGDLLICEGNSEALVGRPAVWRNEIPDCVHQNHILRVRLSGMEPDFVAAYMNTAPARNYFLSRAKRTTNLASINSSDLREFSCPAPPLAIQRKLAKKFAAKRSEARTLREQATELRRAALSRVDDLLVGTP